MHSVTKWNILFSHSHSMRSEADNNHLQNFIFWKAGSIHNKHDVFLEKNMLCKNFPAYSEEKYFAKIVIFCGQCIHYVRPDSRCLFISLHTFNRLKFTNKITRFRSIMPKLKTTRFAIIKSIVEKSWDTAPQFAFSLPFTFGYNKVV